ncbi:hypothetical protein NDU88_011384 [Pleurodeles waltl]|uniref:Uncharacterized protein n=1 Tax=Pleurodeles waltl TaxID=8319 RepID=A0AAV7QX28_PLEWA|nr:hypothetical protein NDU88_011384 [Pleurodeles waltl]
MLPSTPFRSNPAEVPGPTPASPPGGERISPPPAAVCPQLRVDVTAAPGGLHGSRPFCERHGGWGLSGNSARSNTLLAAQAWVQLRRQYSRPHSGPTPCLLLVTRDRYMPELHVYEKPACSECRHAHAPPRAKTSGIPVRQETPQGACIKPDTIHPKYEPATHAYTRSRRVHAHTARVAVLKYRTTEKQTPRA